jgi:hypothetical protein
MLDQLLRGTSFKWRFWAVPLVEAMRESGGVLVDSARIPAPLMEAALEELALALKS